jgi:hypothetical protein
MGEYGGIDGRCDELRITADGQAELALEHPAPAKRYPLTAGERAELDALLASLGATGGSNSEGEHPDALSYAFVFRGHGTGAEFGKARALGQRVSLRIWQLVGAIRYPHAVRGVQVIFGPGRCCLHVQQVLRGDASVGMGDLIPVPSGGEYERWVEGLTPQMAFTLDRVEREGLVPRQRLDAAILAGHADDQPRRTAAVGSLPIVLERVAGGKLTLRVRARAGDAGALLIEPDTAWLAQLGCRDGWLLAIHRVDGGPYAPALPSGAVPPEVTRPRQLAAGEELTFDIDVSSWLPVDALAGRAQPLGASSGRFVVAVTWAGQSALLSTSQPAVSVSAPLELTLP